MLRCLLAADAPIWTKEVTTRTGVPYGTACSFLPQLVKANLAECEVREQPGAGSRNYYLLTAWGRARVEHLLKNTPAPASPAIMIDGRPAPADLPLQLVIRPGEIIGSERFLHDTHEHQAIVLRSVIDVALRDAGHFGAVITIEPRCTDAGVNGQLTDK